MTFEEIAANAGEELGFLVSGSGLEKLSPDVADAVLIVVRGVVLVELAQRLQMMAILGFPEADLEAFKNAFSSSYSAMIDAWVERCRAGALN